MRGPQPWFRASDQWWYVTLREGGRRISTRLVQGKKHKQAALDAWHELMRNRKHSPATVSGETVQGLLDRYLTHVRATRAPETFRIYQLRISEFSADIGPDKISVDLKPHEVLDWLHSRKFKDGATGKLKPWSNGTKNGALAAIRSAFRWAVEHELLEASGVCNLKSLPKGRRENPLKPDEFEAVMKHVMAENFRDLLRFSWLVGCRPQESKRIQAHHVDLVRGVVTFELENSKGKKRVRVLYLSTEAAVILARLLKRHHKGHLFRTQQGRPWTNSVVYQATKRLEARCGRKLCLYDLRHSFTTNGLEKGVDVATMAELMGHADPSTILRTYQHLAKRPEFLREQAKRAAGESG